MQMQLNSMSWSCNIAKKMIAIILNATFFKQ